MILQICYVLSRCDDSVMITSLNSRELYSSMIIIIIIIINILFFFFFSFSSSSSFVVPQGSVFLPVQSSSENIHQLQFMMVCIPLACRFIFHKSRFQYSILLPRPYVFNSSGLLVLYLWPINLAAELIINSSLSLQFSICRFYLMYFYAASYSRSEYDARRKKGTAVVWLLTSHPVHHVLSINHFSLSTGYESSDGLHAAGSV